MDDVPIQFSEDERRVLEIVSRIFPDEDANYYLRAIKRLPYSIDEPKVTWPSIHHRVIHAKKKNISKWQILGQALMENNLIEINSRNGTIRKFS